MANLKAFALNIAKQIKPDDSIECIAEIIEQQIESVWPMTHQPTVGTGQRETELRKLVAKWPHETCTICGRDFSNTERLKHGWLACCREAHPCRRCQVEAALAAHEEGGGSQMIRVVNNAVLLAKQTGDYKGAIAVIEAALTSQEPPATDAELKTMLDKIDGVYVQEPPAAPARRVRNVPYSCGHEDCPCVSGGSRLHQEIRKLDDPSQRGG